MTEEKEFESAFSKGRDTGSPIFENGNEMPVPKDNPGKNGGGSRKVIVLVAGLILCTLLAVGTFAYQTDSLDSLVQYKYSLSEGEQAHQWTYQEFKSLTLSSEYGQSNGMTLKEIIKKYGKGDVSAYKNIATITYLTKSKTYNWVYLSFEKINGSYYLDYKSIDNVEIDGLKISEKPAKPFNKADYNNLKVGDSETGQGGMSYQEIVGKFGNPQENSLIESAGSSPDLSITYENPSNEPKQYKAKLNFKKTQDGNWHLNEKSVHFDD